MNDILILQKRVEDLEAMFKSLMDFALLPIEVQRALEGRGFIRSGGSSVMTVATGGTGASSLTGILKGNGTSAFTAVSPLAGTNSFYVATGSGGAVTHLITFSDGVLIS